MATKQVMTKQIEYKRAFQEDCELLLQRYLLHSTYCYEPFAKIWSERKFGLIFLKDYKDYELGHFTLMLLHCAKKYLIFPKCRYTQTGGLYLLYAIYNKQPIKNLIKIRILHNELQIIKEYLQFMQTEEGCLEPIFIFNSMLQSPAFEFVATQHALPIGNKYTFLDLMLTDDIFPKDGSTIPVDFVQETNNALKNMCAIDKEMTTKLEAYKKKHKEVLIDYDKDNQKELVDALLTDPFSDDSDVEIVDDFLSPSTSTKEVEEARILSERRRNIINKAYSADSRSKYIKQLSGEEKIKKTGAS